MPFPRAAHSSGPRSSSKTIVIFRAMPASVMYRITCVSRAGAAILDRLLTWGRASLMYRITGHYPMAVPGRALPVAIDGRCTTVGPEARTLGWPSHRAGKTRRGRVPDAES